MTALNALHILRLLNTKVQKVEKYARLSGIEFIKNDDIKIDDDKDEDKNIFRVAVAALTEMLEILNSFFIALYKTISDNSKVARRSQDMSNRVDELIAQAAKGDDKTREKLSPEIIDFMKKENIKVDGENIDQYIKSHGDIDGKLDKGALQAVKGALDNKASCATDAMSEMQTEIQMDTQKISLFNVQRTNTIDKWMSLINKIIENSNH